MEGEKRRGAGGMGRGSSCRRLGRDGEMGDGVTANDRLEPAAEAWERLFGSSKFGGHEACVQRLAGNRPGQTVGRN
jgi:hypothetical protein